ncbi:Na+/H+ antiporter [Levilactobacillus zymae]|uniref:Na+/H+ antiporter n=1 Tax=Levilactobacillus zymae TaxID=267363 RepID=A0ABQ0WYK8_9LACO|nr:sodium:proton antiporter [Levilactobacillus zymae]QFR62156.1 Na+/H+ antiporter [Levilactobacillus zymae]GEO72984.1 Na+/H+ antiporter [Levilactobacillus zymae]
MEIFYAVVLLIVATIAANLVYPYFPVIPQAFYQIFAGALLSFVPLFHHFVLEPEMFMLIIIAPLMFHDGQNADTHALRKHIPSVLSMAVILAVLTVILMGYVSHAVIASLPLALAFALAAIVTPTDAVAVSSITTNMAVPEKVMGMLERESLFNDASGLVAFNLALTAFITGEFSVQDGVEHFFVVFLGGLLIGAILGVLFIWGRIYLVQTGMDSTSVIVPYDILTPFIIYLAAEHFELSGILAVVAAGLLRSAASKQIRLSSTQLQLVSRSTWRILTSILNGFVFVLLGVSLPTVWHNIQAEHTTALPSYLLLAVILYLVMFALRYLWIRFDWALIHSAPKDQRHHALVGALSGIHGTITLAMAFSLPLTLHGQAFPFRNTMIFIAAVVIILSLLIPAIVLPLILPSREQEIDPEQAKRERQNLIAYATQQLTLEHPESPDETQAVVEILNSQYGDHRPDRKLVKDLMIQTNQAEVTRIQQLVDENQLAPAYANRYVRGLLWKTRANSRLSFAGFGMWFKYVNHRLTHRLRHRRNRNHHDRRRQQPGFPTDAQVAALKTQREQVHANLRTVFTSMETQGYHAVIETLTALATPDNQAEINAVRSSYNTRHRRFTQRDTSDLQNELFIQAFQYEYNYVRQQRLNHTIPSALADDLYQQISTDQMLYMQEITGD